MIRGDNLIMKTKSRKLSLASSAFVMALIMALSPMAVVAEGLNGAYVPQLDVYDYEDYFYDDTVYYDDLGDAYEYLPDTQYYTNVSEYVEFYNDHEIVESTFFQRIKHLNPAEQLEKIMNYASLTEEERAFYSNKVNYITKGLLIQSFLDDPWLTDEEKVANIVRSLMAWLELDPNFDMTFIPNLSSLSHIVDLSDLNSLRRMRNLHSFTEILYVDDERSGISERLSRSWYDDVEFVEGRLIGGLARTQFMLGMRQIHQMTNRHCGPATALQTITWFRPLNNYTQNQLADLLMGGPGHHSLPDISTIVREVHPRIQPATNFRYTHGLVLNYTNIVNNINNTLRNRSAPVIIRMQAPNTNHWPYTTPGHFLNVSGISNDRRQLRATDPYITHVQSGSNGHFWRSSTDFYRVLTIRRYGINMGW